MKWNLVILLALAAVLFTMNSASLSLRSLDDCFYARKGVELGRSGRFFTVTWNHQPAFQNPPLHFWILGRSFALFGENDFAARFPSILMALGILVLVFLLGRSLFDAQTALVAVAILLVSPHFLLNAKRCMLEIPLAFWMLLTIYFMLQKRLLPLAALSLAAAILTKSILGLLPVLVVAPFGFWKRPLFWITVLAGMMLGASWSIHEAMTFGKEAVRAHYFGEIASRSAQQISWVKAILGYPQILFTVFEPAALLAIPGMILLYKKRQLLPVVWILLPIVLYSFSSARSSRYIFPIFPALALCGGYWLQNRFPRVALASARYVVPAILATAILFIWIRPNMERDENQALKQQGEILMRAVPEEESIGYVGDRYWAVANPVLYYAERSVIPPPYEGGGKGEVPGVVIVDRNKNFHGASIILETRDWIAWRLR